jgi:hypothetical protein
VYNIDIEDKKDSKYSDLNAWQYIFFELEDENDFKEICKFIKILHLIPTNTACVERGINFI